MRLTDGLFGWRFERHGAHVCGATTALALADDLMMGGLYFCGAGEKRHERESVDNSTMGARTGPG